nr:phytanoyl-CoA dioxygenase [uncultured Campylobacter sp.]
MQINGKEIFEKGALMCHPSRMASLEYQDKYIVHPTKDYYILADEIIDWLYDECKNALLEQFRFCFLPYEREILKELVDLIYKYFRDGSLLKGEEEGDYLVYQNKSWIEVRGLALKTLYTFGYDLEDFDYD